MTELKTEVTKELRKALFTYRVLKSNLLDAIETGETSIRMSSFGKDDQCDLGALIYDGPTLRDMDVERYERLRRAHKVVHKEAEAILLLATSGKRYEACRLVSPNSAFTNAALTLESELTAFCEEL